MKPVPRYYWDFVANSVEVESSAGRVVARFAYLDGDEPSINEAIKNAEELIIELDGGRVTEKSLLAKMQ